MHSEVTDPTRGTDGSGRRFPAYGPVEALLGFALFYVLVDRTTATLVAVFTDVLDVAPSAVGFALAAILWFVGTVTLVEQVRRQRAALGVGTHDEVARDARSPTVPSETRALVALATVLVGGLVAAWTFERAVDVVASLARIVGTVDVTAVPLADVAVLVVFFVSYGAATRALDRLVIGGIRGAVWD